MNSKVVLVTSAVVLLAAGLVLNFAPDETAVWLGAPPSPVVSTILQVLAASLLGMGFLNYFSRANIMGGIYGRPLALGNLLLFAISAIVLGRGAHGSTVLLVAAAVSAILALAFAWRIFFADPVAEQETGAKK